MAKAKVKQRKDSKGRVLQKGESQRKLDGMYIYTYVNPYGKRCYVYSKDLFTLREKEQELIKAQMDGLDYYVGGHATINMTFDRYMSTKHNLRETTRSNYLYMFNRFIREDFGNKFLTEVKYTDVKLFYYHLLNEKDIAINTLDTIHTVLHPIFDMAVRDDIINKNPTDGVLAEIKRNSGKNKGIRHALTIEQQAIEAGQRALSSLRIAKENLNSAKNWGLVDMFGGGFFSTMLKHSKMDQARQNMEQAKYDLRNFSRELNDVNMACNLNINTGDFLSFADYFFDGFVVDWMVQDRINNARHQVEEAIRRTEYIINQLQHM